MARGYPDFFGQSIFPKYGGLQSSIDDIGVAVAAGDTETTIDVETKGKIVGGSITVEDSETPPKHEMIMTIDGVEVFNRAIGFAMIRGWDKAESNLLWVSSYQIKTYAHDWRIAGDLSFEENVKIEVKNVAHAPGYILYHHFYYYSVT